MLNSEDTAQEAVLRAVELKNKRKRRQRRLSALVVVICVCVVTVSIILITYQQSERDKGTISIDETDMPLAYPQIFNPNGTQNDTDLIPVFPRIVSVTISANMTDIELYLLNPEENACLLTFEIILSDTGETLCQTGFVEPSKYAGAQSLLRGLPKGEYDAAIIMRAYSPDSNAELGTERGEFVIVAK